MFAPNSRILCIVHEVMYKQLRDWTINGVLNDKYDEFYICVDKNFDGNLESEKELVDEETLYSLKDFNTFEDRFSSSYSQYCLNSQRVPSYLNLKTANKILFTGELLQLFQAKYLNELNSKGDGSKSNHLSEFDKCNYQNKAYN